MTHVRPIPRQTLDEYVEYLATKYPKCFFVDPRMRRPLKKTIVDDLRKERVLDDEKVEAATSFYMNHFGYQYQLRAGAERIDLDGSKVGVVTEQEQIGAEKKVREDKKRLNERGDIGLPVAVLNQLHAAGRIPTDALSKLTAPRIVPQMKKPEPPKDDVIPMMPGSDATADRLETLVASLHDINTRDKELKATLVIATANLVIAEAQKLLALTKEADNG